MKIRSLFFGGLLVLFCMTASAQYRSGGSAADKFYFGGGFGLSFATNYTAISASPLVGYKITDEFSSGLRLTYQYVSDRRIQDFEYTLSNYGGGPFARYLITDRYFAHTEYEYLSFEYVGAFNPNTGEYNTEREGYNALWIGAGYIEPVGRNAGFFILALYNVLYDQNEFSPYASPLSVQAGFSIGF